ncbi:hypothetical protein LMG27174_07095 [Paraburkholderia rhynchosiae]|uniref:Uncharacterized protein n=1 Tax=Paraburkholderia rhynchosiae TaxID=487049 RepID=A0A6J5CRS7_9BURK|nr:hypothetical protein LMG27174_07095 [Paraburkholderia rhynchosiae]
MREAKVTAERLTAFSDAVFYQHEPAYKKTRLSPGKNPRSRTRMNEVQSNMHPTSSLLPIAVCARRHRVCG